MAILIACEESQVECVAFRRAGFETYSCDLQPCSGGHPEWHIQGDVRDYLIGKTIFKTQDGTVTSVNQWELVIAHPPCTYLSAAANTLMYAAPGLIHQDRLEKGLDAAEFFRLCLAAQADMVCVENPRPYRIFRLPKPDQRLNPYEFGEPWSKRTYLWLRNLPPLLPSLFVSEFKSFTYTKKGSKSRSKSFAGIANAMVKQWGPLLEHSYI